MGVIDARTVHIDDAQANQGTRLYLPTHPHTKSLHAVARMWAGQWHDTLPHWTVIKQPTWATVSECMESRKVEAESRLFYSTLAISDKVNAYFRWLCAQHEFCRRGISKRPLAEGHVRSLSESADTCDLQGALASDQSSLPADASLGCMAAARTQLVTDTGSRSSLYPQWRMT